MEDLAKQLEELEKKYGGITKATRNVKSIHEPKNYNTNHQGGDRMNSQYHHYSKIYAKYLLEFLHKPNFKLAEIGVLSGSGLAIWCDVFHTSNIYGFDIDPNNYVNNYKHLIELGAFTQTKPDVYKFDQFENNQEMLRLINNKYDVVIDDGCHLDEAVLTTFKSFLPQLNPKFVYFIEDNGNVYKTLRNLYPEYNVYYENQMTVVTPKLI